jgi:hypothetical protein
VSIIWDLLTESESPQRKNQAIPEVCAEVTERRKSPRTNMYVPLFVYGYTTAGEPFHEDTNTLEVNANGGLLRLDANVRCGQKLLVVNRVTKEEEECRVVTLAKRPKHTDLRVGVAFARAARDFWGSRR